MTVRVVCGLHRSGTTYVGKLLQQAGVTVVHEPLNERFGLKGVPIAYPYVKHVGDEYASLLADAVNFKRAWNTDASFLKVRGIKRSLYQLTGGRSGLKWSKLRLQKYLGLMPEQVCLKDPFMSLVTPYLVKHHQLKVVCMVRHPAAIHYSTAKQGWRFDIQNLRRQDELIASFAPDVSDKQWDMAEKHAAASIAVLWKVMVRINTQLESEKGLKLIKHEDLCIFPVATAKEICSHFSIPFSSEIESFVLTHSQGNRAEAEAGKTHDFKRDSKALVDSWRGKIAPEDEAMIRDIAGLEMQQLYNLS